ncbi:MAG: HAD-IIB family hydrolase, partial [Oscillospiraceae bacterium]|nr:HAD-IIB family hydrolase [Oscillospiraceae bacterium]
MKKLLFFDIDGTLVEDDTGCIPLSTIQAIQDARKAGHLTFINTGRTWSNVDLNIQNIGFDGFLCGCGTEIRYQDNVLFRKTIEPAICLQMRDLVRTCHATPLYERSDTMFYDPSTPALPAFSTLMQLYERKKTLVQDLTNHTDFYFDKFVIWYDTNTDLQQFRSGITPYFDYIDRGYGFAEMVPHGCSKATAMQQIVSHLYMDMQDTIAFGDSLNDLPMMKTANISVGMGNGTALHPYVSFITKDIKEDGIYFAMKS